AVAARERLEIQIAPFERPRRRPAQLAARDAGAAADVEDLQRTVGWQTGAPDQRVSGAGPPLEPEVILGIGFIPFRREIDRLDRCQELDSWIPCRECFLIDLAGTIHAAVGASSSDVRQMMRGADAGV